MFKLSRQEKDHRYFCGNKYEKYSIKKLKIGAASVLVGTGFLFGYNLDQVSANEQSTETTTIVTSKDGDGAQSTDKLNLTTEPKQENTPERVTETPKSESKVDVVSETSSQAIETKEVSENKSNKVDKETVNSSMLRANLADLEAQIERIRGNKKQASQIQNAEKLVAEAKQYLSALDATQSGVDKKANEISSLTFILKSIKTEETVKPKKNSDSRNGKKMQEGTGFREGGAAGTGVGADVVDATSTPAVARGEYTKREDAEAFTKQVTWLDFGDVAHWENIDNEGGKIYLKEGSKYSKEVIPGYIINIKVKSLKPFQATEIYRKRMEAANASEEEKATFNPNATNQHFGEGSGPSRVTADQQDGTWSEVRNNGIDTGNKKTSIGAGDWSNIGVQFEISATYKGKNVRPAVIMNDSESANHGENIVLTTNGSPWERVLELKKERFVGGTFTPTPYKPINNYNLRHEDYPQSGGQNNANQLLGAMRDGLLTLADGTKFAPKYMTNPDQEMGGLGTGVFGPVTSSGGYSLPVLMTKDATEVGLYILSPGIQTAMMGVIPIDEGDAPESYGKASHTINTVNGVTGGEVKQPYLGSTRPDMDTGTTKDWYGDDKDLDGDEGVNQLLPENLKESEGNIIKANISNAGHYTLNVQAHTGGAEKAYIRSWIDFNKNGQFDADEASEIATITTDGTVKLNFKNKRSADVETLLEAGARVRIATAESEIENPTGTAFSGEVEDFIAKITHPPKGEKKTTVGNIKETQREEIHFTAQGKNVYLEDHPNAEIDTTVQPTYIDNKTGQEVTLTSDGTYTVEGEGTYKFAISDNGKDVKVEFTPADGFVGKANGITIRRQDTNKTTTDWGTPDATTLPNVNDSLNTMDGLYIPEVTVPTSVNATPVNADSQNLQGLPQKGKPTFNVESAKEPVTASAKYPAKLVDPRTNTVTELTTVDAFEQGTTNKIGTYTIVPETGEVTFTPNKDFKGIPAPATISADVELTHDKDGNITKKTLTANYTPTIIPVTPTAEASTTSDVQGKVQISPIKLDTEETGDDKGKTVNFDKGTQTGPKGERVELNPETLTLLNEAGAEVDSVTTPQGTYALDKANKTISFTPNKDFVGTATPVKVQIKDMNGTKVETTYTPTVTDVTMESVDKTSEAPQGQTQTGKPEFKISSPDVQITGYKLVDPVSKKPVDGTEIEVPEQGTYKIDPTTGQVTFIPKAGYTGTADGIKVQATDENGETKDAKYTPKVTPLTVTPENKTSKNIQGVPQEGTPTFTIPEGVTNASITSRKLVDPTDNTPKDSVTVEGKGTFVIDETGKVTFTPIPSYTGEVPAIEVQATVTVTNEKNEPATITSKATYKPEIVPLELGKTPATSTNLQGLEQKGTPTFTGSTVEVNGEQKEVTITPNSYTLVKDGAEVTTTPAYKKGTTEEIGTYTINPATGEVTLTPTDKTYTGEVEPAVVQAIGSNNVKVQTTYTPTITPVNPTAEASRTSGVQGKPQTSPIVLDTEETGDDKGKTVNFNKGTEKGPKEERVELNPDTLTLLDGENEVTSVTTTDGKYELDKANKTITFTPNATFTGEAKPVSVRIKDMNGTKVDTTYTPTVTDVTMEGTPKETEAPQGKTQTGKPEFTISSPDVRITGYKLINPTTNTPVDDEEIDVPEQGTYRIDKTTGQVTFIPKAGYTGTADGIKVQATDENGETKDAKYTPKVTPLTVTPENKTSKNIQGVPQEGTPTFTIPEGVTNASITSRKLVDPTDNTPKDSVTVEGKGTFVIDETGKVTFTPVPSYTGEVPAIEVQATVTVTNEKNEPATITSKATYKPEIVPVKPTAEASTTSDVQGKPQTSLIVLDTEETADDKGKTVNFNKGIEQGPKGERTELNPDTLTLLNEVGEEVTSVTTPQGKYELDKANKTITFTPNKDFAGEATPVKVQIKDVNGTKVETTYTPTVIEVTPTGKDSATSGLQGFTQTSPIVFNQKDEADNTTVNFETGHERVELKQDTLTLVNENGEKVTTITVPEVGTYELKDGAITFTPVKTFKGTAEGVTVQVEDENGKVVTKKYIPTVIPVTPEGENAETEGPKAQPQTSTIVFDKKDEDNATVNFNKGHESVTLDPTTTTLVGKDGTPTTEVKVPGEGTYTLANNVITFTPEPEFAGKATGVTVQVKDVNGTVVTQTYTPTVRPITTFVDEAGNPITVDKNNTPVVPEEDGTLPKKDIYGYKLVRTETDKKGNTKHIYEPAKGESVKVSYVSTTGEVLKDSQTVQPKDTLVGTGYDASTETIKLERIEKDGKVYLLKERKADSASENGKVSDKEQTITYVYEEVKEPAPKQNYGSVVVVYTDKFGRPISGITETGKEVGNTVLDTSNAPLNTKYDTTDNRPQTITTKDGKVYTLKKVTKNSDAEQSGVKGRTSVVTYVYEMLNNTEELPEAHVGVVLVNYQDEDGNLISGKTPEGKEIPNVVVDTDATLVGEKYDTTDNKPSVIIAENGDVYELVKASATSVETGEVVEGATIVDYIYRKAVTTFVDETGKELKSSEKGTKSKEEISGYVFKETKKDEKGKTVHVYQKVSTPREENESKVNKPSEKVASSNPSTSTPSIDSVLTTFVDENGNVIIREENGSHPGREIEGYELIGVKRDSRGNVRNVYRKIQSQKPVQPVEPATPAQPVQPTAVKEAEGKRELPNTGTEDNASLAALGLLGVLSGFGLVARKKKED